MNVLLINFILIIILLIYVYFNDNIREGWKTKNYPCHVWGMWGQPQCNEVCDDQKCRYDSSCKNGTCNFTNKYTLPSKWSVECQCEVTKCAAGYKRSSTTSTDAECKPCEDGYYSALNDESTSCTAHTSCSDWEYESEAPSSKRNRVCRINQCTCSNGTGADGANCDKNGNVKCAVCDTGYWLNNDECKSVNECQNTEFELKEPSATSDRKCADRTSCGNQLDGTGRLANDSPKSAGTCKPCAANAFAPDGGNCKEILYGNVGTIKEGENTIYNIKINGEYKTGSSGTAPCPIGFMCKDGKIEECKNGTYQDEVGKYKCK